MTNDGPPETVQQIVVILSEAEGSISYTILRNGFFGDGLRMTKRS
ncbi:MAG: hypothetical protein AVDCRST_MAG93-3526 [uncultured Chloroflexia bacterium]|uniref:Uncharacterized protein n=1 Tax=uncultured Chloroflexia bacterium TaxID=1672391 RepID=A0A6J4JRX4_9CHLR|nr:MAG: hypothetical protein AVDCRST_MAG93-3526 [uncultured Chloroflexia bacterium]